MPDADRRVPTAADVERYGPLWWYQPGGCPPRDYFLFNGGSELRASINGMSYSLSELDNIMDGTWLGPVNPEPLPWPEGGR